MACADYPGLHAQGPHRHRLPRLRAEAAREPRRRLSAVRDAQRGDADRGARARRRLAKASSSSACTAWASRCTSTSSAPDKLDLPCRIYAPVGTHETLLAYLVRRLLENGANTSFVNQVADERIDLDRLVEDPVTAARAASPARRIRGSRCRRRSIRIGAIRAGLDLADEHVLASLERRLGREAGRAYSAQPLLADGARARRRRTARALAGRRR